MKHDRKSGHQARKQSPSRSGNQKTVNYPDTKKRGGTRLKQGIRKQARIEQAGIPSALIDLVDSYMKEKTGKDTGDPVFLNRLRQSVIAQKASYWHEKPGKAVKYGRGYDIFSYLAYHFPVYFTQFRSILQSLKNEHILPDPLVVLDIGTGPGVVPLAFADLLKGKDNQGLEIFSIEQSEEHREAFKTIVHGYVGSDPAITVHDPVAGDLVKIAEDGHCDLPEKVSIISFQNVLAELEHLSVQKRADIVRSYAQLLDEDGFIIIVEPAELRHATSLRSLQQELVKRGLHVYAPCSYLWGCGCSSSSCWTFQEEPPIPSTPLMNLMAGEDEGYRFLNTDIKYSYLVLSKKPISRCAYRIPRKTRMVRLSHLERYDRRITNVTAARMSDDIGTHGMHIFKICDGTCREPVYAVLSGRNRRPGHSALFTSSYGQVLIFSCVQVRKHQVHHAWNLIIGPDSRINKVVTGEKNPEPDIGFDTRTDTHQATGIPPVGTDKKNMNNSKKMNRLAARKDHPGKG